jgi:hypothetical protein
MLAPIRNHLFAERAAVDKKRGKGDIRIGFPGENAKFCTLG